MRKFIILFKKSDPLIASGNNLKEITKNAYEYNCCDDSCALFAHALDGVQYEHEYIALYNTFIKNPDDIIDHIYEIEREIGLKPDQEMHVNI